jgi:O-antigen ligase
MKIFGGIRLLNNERNINSDNNEMAYAVAFWVWLSLILLSSIVFSVNFPHARSLKQYISVLSLVWPVVFMILNKQVFCCKKLNIFSALFMLSVVLSSIFTYDPFGSILMGLFTIISFYISYLFIIKINRSFFLCSYIYSIISAIAILYYIYYGNPAQVRMEGLLNPNSLAMYAVSGALITLILRNRLLLILLCPFFFFIIILSGSRASLISLCIGVLAYLVIQYEKPKNVQVSYFFFILASLLYLLSQYYDVVWQSISSTLALDDSYRGLGTGFTGRDIAWAEAWNIFLENPLFGVGYRAHERIMTTQSSAHNGYLATLAELGLFGSVIIAFGICTAFYKLIHMSTSLRRLCFPIVLSYLFLCFFERYLFNLGNPLSLLFTFSFIYCFVYNTKYDMKINGIKIA